MHIYFWNLVVRFVFSSVLKIWYVEVRISRSVSEGPFKFEITRVDCISYGPYQCRPCWVWNIPCLSLSYRAREVKFRITRWSTTVIILNIGTDRSEQTVQTQIRLLLMEQSDQGLLCLLFCLHLLTQYCSVKSNCSNCTTIMVIISGVPIFRILTVIHW